MGNKRKTKESVAIEVVFPTYTLRELEDFGTWLEKFRKKREVSKMDGSGMEEIKFLDLREAMVDFGAMKRGTHAGVVTYATVLTMVDEEKGQYVRPAKVELFDHKYNEWARLVWKRNNQNKSSEDYVKMRESVAEGMTTPPPNEFGDF